MGNFAVVNGIILSSMPVGEFDRRLVILTKERGKISVFAKGSRRVNSPLCGVTRVFAMGNFELYEGRNSYDLKNATISNYFNELASDFDTVYYGYYFCELADYFTRENLDGGPFLNLLYCGFRALIAKAMNKDLVRYVFEFKALVLNGEYPEVFLCRQCEKEVDDGVFSLYKQGVLCKECAGSAGDGIAVSGSTLYTLQYMVTISLDRLFTFNVSSEVLTELRMVINRLMSANVDKKLKTLEILEQIKNA